MENISNNNFPEEYRKEFDMITLYIDENGKEIEMECIVFRRFEALGKNYAALLPIQEIEKEESSLLLYRVVSDDEEDMTLDYIKDEEEYEIVSDAFDELMDLEEFNELINEED